MNRIKFILDNLHSVYKKAAPWKRGGRERSIALKEGAGLTPLTVKGVEMRQKIPDTDVGEGAVMADPDNVLFLLEHFI